MKYLIVNSILLLITNVTIGQTKTDFSKPYIEDLYKSSYKIKSSAPNETNFDDLEPIGKSIGDAKIVLLGEPSHGDGGAIEMKTKLVKYLHEKKGFDVLLFEADLYSIIFGSTGVKDTTRINLFAKNNIYTCWSGSKVSRDLWSYYNKQLVGKNPINIGGIDCRHAGEYAKNTLIKNLSSVLKSIDFNTTTSNYERFTKDLQYILTNEFSSKKDSVDVENFNSEIINIEEFIKFSALEHRTRNLWLIEMNNIKGCFDLIIYDKSRDIVMAKNFINLLKYIYPNKKIIVWSHNNHNVLDVKTYTSFSFNSLEKWDENNTLQYSTYFGTEIFKEFQNQVYSLAITSGSGNFSPRFFGDDMFHADFSKTAKVPKSSEQSLEYFLKSKNNGALFIPFPNTQGRPSGYPWFSARLLDLMFESKMDYTASFNGVIYLDKTVDLNGQ